MVNLYRSQLFSNWIVPFYFRSFCANQVVDTCFALVSIHLHYSIQMGKSWVQVQCDLHFNYFPLIDTRACMRVFLSQLFNVIFSVHCFITISFDFHVSRKICRLDFHSPMLVHLIYLVLMGYMCHVFKFSIFHFQLANFNCDCTAFN